MLGSILGKKTLTKKAAKIFAVVCVSSVFITIVATYMLTIHNARYSGYFGGYLTPNVIFFSVSAFALIKYAVTNISFCSNKQAVSAIKHLSDASLGIYLIHPIFLAILNNGNLGFSLSAFDGSPIYSIPLTSIIVFSCSYLATILFKRIPIVKII
jgi:surface polysaccharide O-acyltransferase-like enzyme